MDRHDIWSEVPYGHTVRQKMHQITLAPIDLACEYRLLAERSYRDIDRDDPDIRSGYIGDRRTIGPEDVLMTRIMRIYIPYEELSVAADTAGLWSIDTAVYSDFHGRGRKIW